ncbi:hypothetical protein [Phaeovulum sp.]|uniref:hypothetical protein n=1 Tax=Phaeovulum sp. TaxID=2934796 RepID=UPI0039E5908F
MPPAPVPVKRRRVFYIPGYDPIHPRRYRELYRKEGAAQAMITGYDLTLKPKQAGGPYGWHVEATIDGQKTQTDFEVLIWSDIVRDSMGRSIPATYRQLVQTSWAYISSGALFGLMRLRKGPIIAALYPIVMLLAQALVGVLAGWAVAALILCALPDFPFDGLVGFGLTALVLILTLNWFHQNDSIFYAYYLMHDYAFSAQSQGAYPPALETRIAAFGNSIATALTEPWDEVLVIGHSSGAHLAISILADLIRQNRIPAFFWRKYSGGLGAAPPASSAPALGLLSLGQVVPMVSYLPRADRLRADLHDLSTHPELTWVDVTAPGDGCAFALCDPVAVSGVAPKGKRWPLVISAAFSQSLSPERWRTLRWRFFRLHFQYICAFDRPRDYDYFQITAGPQTLADRYKDRAPSKSRIERATNRFTSRA